MGLRENYSLTSECKPILLLSLNAFKVFNVFGIRLNVRGDLHRLTNAELNIHPAACDHHSLSSA